MVVSSVVYKRTPRGKRGKFCCYDSSVCKFYVGNIFSLCLCAQIEVNYNQKITTGFHLCSYLNYKESNYIYALQKTI